MIKTIPWRRLAQASVLTLVLMLTMRHIFYGVEKAASIDAYCPFGAVEGLITFITTGEFLKRLWVSVFILMGLTVGSTLIFGRVFCGYFCPLGALQEWIRGLGRKIGIKKDIELPVKLDRVLRYGKYLVLLAIIYFSWQAGDLVFRDYDPYNALMHLGNEWEEKMWGYGILAFVLASALFSKSWWCRYACPLGASLAIIKKISPFKITRNASTCTSCTLCHRQCPANLPVDKQDMTRDADCISCLNCVKGCPTNSLSAKITRYSFDRNKAWKLSSIIAVTFSLLTVVAVYSPWWQSKAPSNLINQSGTIDIENLRGSNTLKYLVEITKIPLEDFSQEFNLPADINPETKLKDIGMKYDLKNKNNEPLEAEDFKEFVEKRIK